MIKQAAPTPNEHVKEAINRVLESGMYVKGPEAEEFEKKFESISGCKYNIAVNSGTSALNLILLAFDYPAESEIIVPVNTFMASGNVVETSNYNVKFADVDYKTMNIDTKNLETLISAKTKAIMVVHLFGQPVNMDEVMQVANKRGIDVIEDACQAHGATYKNQKIGSIGKISSFSLFPTKNLSVLGDGGMVSTNDTELADRIRSLRNAGRQDNPDNAKYFGFNMRLSEILAAIGNAMLETFEEDLRKRQDLAEGYNSYLADLPEIELPFVIPESTAVWHQYTIKTDRRDELKEFLKHHAIQSSVKYSIPLHLVDSFQQKYGHQEGDFPMGERTTNSWLCLPMHPLLTDDDIQNISLKIKEFFK
ncbi:MAG: DegT/DnrJ/EryC1/StrS aminotransferase family protein [Candidatus Heimdallarchaeota archaeon]|nr:DegT/DnrJ/EryC1/StrS aminotransferase family protein [Candidatus Heimdallarchaeota archaeon]